MAWKLYALNVDPINNNFSFSFSLEGTNKSINGGCPLEAPPGMPVEKLSQHARHQLRDMMSDAIHALGNDDQPAPPAA